jgi:ribonuclease BN (tRNA processing enzyme)
MTAYAYRIDSADRSIVISGDTTPCQSLINLARGADVLVHEVMDVPSLALPLSRTNGSRLLEHLVGSHTSVTEVGRIAAEAQVSTLVLSHLVPADADLTPEQWAKEAANGFDGRVIVGEDLMVL